MSEPFIGQIIGVGFNYAPQGWALCDGSTLPISENEALFNLIGTQFGGNGVSTFNLPDLRGRAALGEGQGPGLQNYVIGQPGGAESVALTAAQIGGHTHALSAASGATTQTPGPSVVLGTPAAAQPIYATAGAPASLSSGAVSTSQGGAPHENRQPRVTINYIISLVGVYPAQS